MILSHVVEQYILHKRSLGIGFRIEAVRLRAFIQAIGDCEMHLIEPAPVLRFLEGSGPLTTFWFSKDAILAAPNRRTEQGCRDHALLLFL